jgi:hypothetical protein
MKKQKKYGFMVLFLLMTFTTTANAMFSDIFGLIVQAGKINKIKEQKEQKIKSDNSKINSIIMAHKSCLLTVKLREDKYRKDTNNILKNFGSLKIKDKKTILKEILKKDQYFLRLKNSCLQKTYNRVLKK